MYKSFNESMTLIRGAGCGLESMGVFSLFGDESWRIPTPFSHRNQPCENDEMKDGPDVKKTIRSSLFDNANRKASTQSPHRHQGFIYYEMKEKVGVRKATHSSLIDTENRIILTGPIEQSKACDENEAKDETDVKMTAHHSQFHNEGRKPPTDFVDPKEKAYEQLEHDTTMIIMTCTALVMLAVLTLFLLGTFMWFCLLDVLKLRAKIQSCWASADSTFLGTLLCLMI